MPLELATSLRLRDETDGSPADPTSINELVVAWSERKPSASVTAETSTVEEVGKRWFTMLQHPDENDTTILWRTEIDVFSADDATEVTVKLYRDSTEYRLRPLSGSPQPPRLVRDLIAAPEIESVDGPLRITERYRELSANDASGFVETHLLDSDRRLPVIGVAKTHPSTPQLDLARLTKSLAGFAHVFLVDGPALSVLYDHLGTDSLNRASIRIWWPGIELDDDPSIHPSWEGPFVDVGAVEEQIRRQVLGVSRDRWKNPPRLRAFERAEREADELEGRAQSERTRALLETAQRDAAAARAEAIEAGRKSEADDRDQQLEEITAGVTALQARYAEAIEQRNYYYAEWENAELRNEKLGSEKLSLKGRIDGLVAQLQAKGPAGATDIPSSETELFAADVRQAWESEFTSHDRTEWPLCDFAIRGGFVESITKATADRTKVVSAVMHVACGRAAEINGRNPHKLRTGAGGNDPERTRTSDGAEAWRCNVQTNSPSARRLHYWKTPSGVVEFVSVVVHDNFTIDD
jgi:hypothetical protein